MVNKLLIISARLYDNKLKDFYVVYSTTEDYRVKSPEMIVKIEAKESFNFAEIDLILSHSENLKQKLKLQDDSHSLSIKTCIALIKGNSINIISVSSINPLNNF